jgi:hypothetical protein
MQPWEIHQVEEVESRQDKAAGGNQEMAGDNRMSQFFLALMKQW